MFNKKRLLALVVANSELDENTANEAVDEYKKFLQMCKAFPESTIVPSPVIDTVWHTHILDTVQYVEDCEEYFGHYLHHNPCLDGVDEEEYRQTMIKYRMLFGSVHSPLWLDVSKWTCGSTGCSVERMEKFIQSYS